MLPILYDGYKLLGITNVELNRTFVNVGGLKYRQRGDGGG